ncbi:MAG TPA: histidine phosphatase family protein [Nitrospirota bacterium]
MKREKDFTRLYLCRHGEVAGDGRKRYNGHIDIDISDNGVQQMEMLRDQLIETKISAAYSSDLIRSKKGAEIIGGPHGAPRVSLAEFRERGVGAWEGKSWDEIQAEFPGEWSAWLSDIVHFLPPGGESLMGVAGRVMPALGKVIEENRGGEILLVGHGGVNRVILADAMKLDLHYIFRIDQDFGCLNIIDYYEDGVSVVKLLNG